MEVVIVEARTATGYDEECSALTILDLLSYRLHRVANGMSRSAALRFRREFNVSLGEWRAIALIGADPRLTVSDLARLAGLDKAQMSRVVSKLGERGLVSRQAGLNRSTQLSLSQAGERMYRGLIGAACERNDAFISCLTSQERKVLGRVIDKLSDQSRRLEQTERELAERSTGLR